MRVRLARVIMETAGFQPFMQVMPESCWHRIDLGRHVYPGMFRKFRGVLTTYWTQEVSVYNTESLQGDPMS